LLACLFQKSFQGMIKKTKQTKKEEKKPSPGEIRIHKIQFDVRAQIPLSY